jgi:2-keto-4-pentenoate hydratase/2-oxohepta-3-ene-1,7-dioic acid hydratase in catechol pathway
VAVHVVRFRRAGAESWGIARDGRIQTIPGSYGSTAELLTQGAARARELAGRPAEGGVAPGEVEILSPITTPCRVICLGANYRQHMIESGLDPDAKTFNMFFTKSSASVAPPSTDIRRPAHVRLLDYEIELALVIGRQVSAAVDVTPANLHEFVAGVTIANDVSARDVQIPQSQFFKGKSYRTFCPLGPYLCLLEHDELPYLDRLELTLTVNGEVRQHDTTANLVFKPAETLTELSGFSDLSPGDVVLTGTPAGCALKVPSPLVTRIAGLIPEAKKWALFVKGQSRSPRYLKEGDVVRSAIRSPDRHVDLGEQVNRVTAARAS